MAFKYHRYTMIFLYTWSIKYICIIFHNSHCGIMAGSGNVYRFGRRVDLFSIRQMLSKTVWSGAGTRRMQSLPGSWNFPEDDIMSHWAVSRNLNLHKGFHVVSVIQRHAKPRFRYIIRCHVDFNGPNSWNKLIGPGKHMSKHGSVRSEM